MTAHLVFPNDCPDHTRLVELTARACGLAHQSISHAVDTLINGSPLTLNSVRRCEEELDIADREMDQKIASTVTQATPEQARELLGCMKMMLDLERVGDLVLSFAERSAIVRNRIDMEDVEQLTRMGCMLENMLSTMSRAFATRDVELAIRVLRADGQVDRLRNLLVIRHTENADGIRGPESLHVLAMADALERAGDHLKNVAEELCHLATGHTMRHFMRTKDKPIEQLFLDWLARQELRPLL